MVLEGMKQERRTERDPSQRRGERWKSLWLGFLKATLSPLLPSLFPLWPPQNFFLTLFWNWGWPLGPFLVKKALSRFVEGLLGKIFCFLINRRETCPCPPYLLEMLSWGQNLTTMKQSHKDKDNTLRLAEQTDASLGNLTVIETLSEPWKYLTPGFL